MLLNSSHVVNILVVLVQAVASFVLIVRHRQVEYVTLLLDSANGLYAMIELLSACNSLMILAVGGKWKILDHTDLAHVTSLNRVTCPEPEPWDSIHKLTVATMDTTMMSG